MEYDVVGIYLWWRGTCASITDCEEGGEREVGCGSGEEAWSGVCVGGVRRSHLALILVSKVYGFWADTRDDIVAHCEVLGRVDEAPKESVAFMTILSDYGLNVLSEIPNYNTYHDNTINVILYDQYLKESKNEVVQSIVSPDQQNAMIMSIIEEMSSQVAKCNAVNQENKTVNESLTVELERYKE
ncbi:hypothetical protein Tco_1002624 [Tanacetum coccineum]|uniref:Uncharacterized protein n=1 Tax=Tanacetum coccineum TaxID=301880 RepID=A0ABQ5F6R9_9ASTR